MSSPRIYPYDLGREINVTCPDITHGLYGTSYSFPSYLKQSPNYESDPTRAHFFFVPILALCVRSVHLRYKLVEEAIRVIKPLGYWDKVPERHIWMFTLDHGFCGAGPNEAPPPQLTSSIILSSWGLTKHETNASPEGLDRAQTGSVCFTKGRDIVIPPASPVRHGRLPECGTYPKNADAPLLFFAGSDGVDRRGLHHGLHYSHGVRQTLFRMFKNKTGFDLTNRAPNHRFKTAHFCLAPNGGGFGNRLTLALAHGCVPLIVQPFTALPFEEVLEYSSFSLRLELYKLHGLPEILRKFTSDPVKMSRLAETGCDARFDLIWEWAHPKGRAFSNLMKILAKRLVLINATLK